MCGLGPLPVPTIRTLAGAHDEVVEAARPFVDRWRHAPLGRRRLQDSWMVLGCGLLDSCRSAPSRSNQRKRVDLLNTYSKQEHWLSEFRRILEMPRTELPPRVRKPKQVQHGLRPDEVSQLVLAYQQGATQTELAARFQINVTTVVAHLQRQGVTLRKLGLNRVQIEEAARIYADGWSLTKIGDRFGVYPQSIRYRLRQAGVQ